MTRLASALLPFIALLAAPVAAAESACQWRPAWASAQMEQEGDNLLHLEGNADLTFRQIVRTTIAGTQLRAKLSNAFGTEPLTIQAASVAKSPDNHVSAIDPASLHPLLFSGARTVTIPAGAEMLSDPIDMGGPVPAASDLAISIHYTPDAKRQTSHPGARATSYFAPGDQTDATDLKGAATTERWFQLAAVEALNCAKVPVVAVLGDSITDGRGSTTNGNDRWPDILARRLNGRAAVLNQGIGGNRLLLDGLGPNALARLDRDVLAQPGITHLILLEGINDLGMLTRDAPATPAQHHTFVKQIIQAYAQIVERARARGIKVIGGTVMPDGAFDYYHPDALNEADRQAVNAWIRTPGNFDAVVDFDAIMRDPAHLDRLNPAFDVGDHIHPNPAGYRAMGEAVPLDLILP